MDFKNFFRGFARVTRTFKLEYRDFKAEGPPAILLSVAAMVLAGGVARALIQGADRLPDTLKEARGLAAILKSDVRELPS
ncbi:MAG: hypothetical protein M3Y21_06920 [Candidatus Eremiobacteraeota bacterium]|nr:hypothetical protein [Candidatus Eremiobacteraeota bacterium]